MTINLISNPLHPPQTGLLYSVHHFTPIQGLLYSVHCIFNSTSLCTSYVVQCTMFLDQLWHCTVSGQNCAVLNT